MTDKLTAWRVGRFRQLTTHSGQSVSAGGRACKPRSSIRVQAQFSRRLHSVSPRESNALICSGAQRLTTGAGRYTPIAACCRRVGLRCTVHVCGKRNLDRSPPQWTDVSLRWQCDSCTLCVCVLCVVWMYRSTMRPPLYWRLLRHHSSLQGGPKLVSPCPQIFNESHKNPPMKLDVSLS